MGDPKEVPEGFNPVEAVWGEDCGVTRRELADLLRTLHVHGCWIEAWYPLPSGDFECRITGGAGRPAWAVDPDALTALARAMRIAGLPSTADEQF